MEIRITYVGTLNGVNGMWCGFKPEGAVITEERQVLYPADGYELKNKISGEIVSAVWLNSAAQEEDWDEVKTEEPEIEVIEDGEE